MLPLFPTAHGCSVTSPSGPGLRRNTLTNSYPVLRAELLAREVQSDLSQRVFRRRLMAFRLVRGMSLPRRVSSGTKTIVVTMSPRRRYRSRRLRCFGNGMRRVRRTVDVLHRGPYGVSSLGSLTLKARKSGFECPSGPSRRSLLAFKGLQLLTSSRRPRRPSSMFFWSRRRQFLQEAAREWRRVVFADDEEDHCGCLLVHSQKWAPETHFRRKNEGLQRN